MTLTRARTLQYVGILLALATIAAGYWYFAVRAGVKTNTSGSQTQGVGDLSAGLTGYWKLDETTGSSAADASTNSNTGTLTSMEDGDWVAGQIGNGLDFDGVDEYVNVPDSGALRPESESWSISVWAKPDNINQLGPIVTKRQTSGSFEQLYFVVSDTSGSSSGKRLFMSRIESAGGTYRNVVSSADFVDGNWHHLVGVADQGKNTLDLYIDGVLVSGTKASVGSWPTVNNTDPLRIGNNNSTAYYNGAIDEVRTYGRALSADEISSLYRLTAPTGVDTSLKGYWSFNSNALSGTKAYDWSGAGNTGTLTNGPVITEGRIGQALNFDGTNDFVTIPAAASINDLATLTVSGWFSQTSCSSGYCQLVGKGYGVSTPVTGWRVAADVTGSGRKTVGFLAEFSGTNLLVESSTTYDESRWNHFAVTWDGSTNASNVHIYLNGTEVKYLTQTNATGSYTSDAAQDLDIGSFGGTSEALTGKMDEVRIYDRIVSMAEIKSQYDRGNPDKTNTGAGQAQGTGRLDSGLIGYWKLDENTGTSAGDASVNGNTGTLTNGPTWTTGQIGSAVSFDGSNDYINTSDSDVYAPATISAFAWVKRSASNGRIFSKDNGGLQRDFELKIDSSNNVEFTVWNQAGSPTTVNGGSTVDTNWHLVGGTWDGATVRTYLDGVEQSSGALSGTSVFNGTDPLEIGRYSFNTEYFTGFMDELRLYDRVLSTDEIMQLYRLTTPTAVDTGLRGYWSFNGQDMTSTTAYDRSGAGNTGTLTNSPTIAEGRLGQALDFFSGGTDSDEYITMGDPASGSLDFGTGDFTVGFWTHARGYVNQGSSTNAFVSKTNLNSANTAGYAFYYKSNNLPTFYIGDGTTSVEIIGSSSLVGDWHHVIGVRSGGTASLYIDGMLASSNSSLPSGTLSNSENFYVSAGGTVGLRNIDGQIDEVRAYARALSAAEIKSQYELAAPDKTNTSVSTPQGTGRLDSDLVGYWKLDENTGTSVADASTNGNTGTLNNGPTWTTGQIGSAVDFDGIDDDFTTSSVRGVVNAAISVWIRPDSVTGTHTVIRHDNNFGIDLVNDEIRWYWEGGGAYHSTTAANLTTGQWYHIVGTYFSGSSSDNVQVYLNGAAQTLDNNDEVNTPTGSSGVVASSWLGAYYDGRIDEVRIYSRTLSADEAGQLYRLSAPTGTDTGLKGYWSFNGQDLSGTTAYDRSGAGNNGTLTNGPTVTEGKLGQALDFDGAGDYIDAGSASSLDSIDTLSACAWIYPNTAGELGTNRYGGIFTKVSAGSGFWIGITDDTGSNKPFLYQGFSGTDGGWYSASATISLNQWTHFCVTWDSSSPSNDPVFYLDGVAVALTESATPSGTVTHDTGAALRIGTNDTGGQDFDGKIDEARIYNRILSASEIKTLYSSGK